MAITVTRDNIGAYVSAVVKSAECARMAVQKCASGDALKMLYCMKFEPLGFEPLNSEVRLNLIEQLNQAFTCLTSFAAARELFVLHPSLTEVTMNIGNANGPDIVGSFRIDGTTTRLCCEVFAAVDPKNNGKLSESKSRVREADADLRYVFFFAPGYRPGPLKKAGGVCVYVVDPRKPHD